MATVGVLLSGCGVFDGSEIHEAVCALLALDGAGAEVVCLAPNVEQARVMDHASRKPAKEKRNCLVEAARIARGEIREARAVRAADLDALVLPGGLGAATTLSNYASKGKDCEVEREVERLIGEMLDAGKPVGAACIAPPILARVAQRKGLKGVKLTIGNSPGDAANIEAMGQAHVACAADQVVVDDAHRVASTPAYMLAGRIGEVEAGMRALVRAVLELAG